MTPKDSVVRLALHYQEAAAYLEVLFAKAPGEQYLEIRAIRPGGCVWQTFHRIEALRRDGWDKALPLGDDGNLNVYYGVCPRHKEGGTAKDVNLAVAVWVDEITQPWPDGLLLPSAIVETSPGKHQAVWFLEQPTAELNQVEAVNQKLEVLLGGDTVFDRPRILRLPGFLNVKPEHPERPRSRLVEFHPDRRYILYQMEKSLAAFHLPERVIREREYRGTFAPHKGDPLPQEQQDILHQFLAGSGLRIIHDGRYAGPCPFPHVGGACSCESAFYASPETGQWWCFCSDHPGPDGRSVASGGARALLARAAGEEPWPPLGELPRTREVPNLPSDLIPAPLRDWLTDIAARACIPLEFVASPALVGVSAIVGRSVGIQPGRFDDWLVVPNLWGGIVGRPGVMKSYAVGEALKPLSRLAADARDRHQAQEALDSARRDRIEAEIGAIKAAMGKVAKERGKPDIQALETELANKKADLLKARSTEKRYMTQDATVEKLGELLNENPRGLLVFRDELAGWLRTLDKPGREGDREFYLESWNGTGSYTFDRIGRGTVPIPAVTLALVGGIQPGKLKAYIDEATAEGGGADGLLQRLQLLVWPDGVGQWQKADRWPDETARDRAYAVFKALDRLKPPGDGEIPSLQFAPDAQALFDAWRDELENRLRSEELAVTPTFESHLAKYRSLMPSLALLFHLINTVDSSATFATGVDGGSGEISPEIIPAVSLEPTRLAAAWCDFLEAHARKVYSSELAPDVEAANTLAKKIRAGDVKDGASVRSLYEHHWSGVSTSQQVIAALEVLTSVGWVRVDHLETGGRPSDVVRLHPGLLGSANG